MTINRIIREVHGIVTRGAPTGMGHIAMRQNFSLKRNKWTIPRTTFSHFIRILAMTQTVCSRAHRHRLTIRHRHECAPAVRKMAVSM